MNHKNSRLHLKQVFRPSRLIPFLTIIGAGTAIVLSIIDIIKLSTSENIVIALLALLAIDAFIERLSLLEKIESRLSDFSNEPNEQKLRKRDELLKPPEKAKYASEIYIIAVSAVSVMTPHIGFYKNRLKEGCQIKIILLDPDSPSLETWNLLATNTLTKSHIKSTLGSLTEILSEKESKGKCEVKLLNVYLPYSMFCIDLSKDSGAIQIEYYPYKLPIDERPHIDLTKSNSPYWYNYYKDQFEKAWSDAVPWNSPQSNEMSRSI